MTSPTQITPRKRKSVSDIPAQSTSTPPKSLTRKRGPPTPNPPLATFPTPPSSRTRKAPTSSHQTQIDRPLTPPATPKKTAPSDKTTTLPPDLQILLNLHHALNLAICLHIATHPPVLPPHAPNTTQIQLKAVTNYLAIKDTVERTSGRRFGHAELGRLAWIWNWDGESFDTPISEKSKSDDENPFLVTSDTSTNPAETLSALTYIISPTRTLDPISGNKTHTYGLGIDLGLQAGETRQILLNGAEGGLGNRGQGGGVRLIGRWSAGGKGREEVVRSRLERWVELHGGYEPPVTDLPTPSTGSSLRSTIPPIPILPLPKLPTSSLLPSINLFSLSTSSTSHHGGGLTSIPKKAAPPSVAGLSDPFEFEEKKPKGQVVRSGSVEERRAALYERIKARSAKTVTLGSAIKGKYQLSAIEQQEELQRRSTLSRLEGIAEAVWMMFSTPQSGPSTNLTSLPTGLPRHKRRLIPLIEMTEILVKSSKTPISHAEAKTSLEMLTQLCPFFLSVKVIAKQEWLEMPSGVIAGAPVSPSREGLGHGQGQGQEVSPGGKAVGVGSPKQMGRGVAIVGPASPGRVRRVGGLREVRERIRRELGE